MKLEQSRIRSIDRFLSDLEDDCLFYIGLKVDEHVNTILEEKLGIQSAEAGTSVFPEPTLGIMNKRNSIGDFTIDKDKPLEPYQVARTWSFVHYRNGQTYSGTSYDTRFRYHRDIIDPKEMKLLITLNNDNELIVIIDQHF